MTHFLFMPPFLRTSSLILLSTHLGLGQDQLSLGNGDRFIGKVIALEDGLIQLQSPHGVDPLQIPNKSLVELKFSKQGNNDQKEDALPKDSQELVLKNGDRFPGQVIALDDSRVTFKTWFTGDLEISREEIESIYFGVTPQKTVYSGPDNLQEWDTGNTRSWRLADGSLMASQKSMIGRDVNLPGDFIFRSTVGWQSTPNSRIYLCTDRSSFDSENPGNCYRIVLGSSTILVERIVNRDGEKTRLEELIKPTIALRARDSKKVEIELRVDRASRMLRLYVDGERIGQGVDPHPAPGGSCLVFESMNHANGDMTVDKLTISEWDTETRKLRIEPKAQSDLDTLAVDDGDRFSGKIVAYDATESKEAFAIMTSFSPDPLQIPLEHCAVLYFSDGAEDLEWKGSYLINLRIGGKLTLSEIKLNPETLSATHPWLGKLEIDRRVMESITKSN